MEPEKLNIDDLKKLVAAIGSLGSVAGEVFEDGKISLTDLVSIGKLGIALSQLALIDYEKVLPEVKNLSSAEIMELHAIFADKFDMPQDALEAKVEKIFLTSQKLFAVIVEAIILFKK